MFNTVLSVFLDGQVCFFAIGGFIIKYGNQWASIVRSLDLTDTVNDTDAFNNAMGVATVLLAINQLILWLWFFIEVRVIKDKIAIVV